MARLPRKIKERAQEIWPDLQTVQEYDPPENHGDSHWFLAVALAYEEAGKLTQARTYAALASATCQLMIHEPE